MCYNKITIEILCLWKLLLQGSFLLSKPFYIRINAVFCRNIFEGFSPFLANISKKKGERYMEKTVNRRFYYYDIDLYTFDPGKNASVPVADFKNAIVSVFNTIKDLKYIEDEPYDFTNLVYKTQNSDFIFVIVDDINDKAIELRIVLSRKDEFPYIEEDGTLKPLTDFVPALKAGLAEITHMVIFPEYKVFGAEFNFRGARPSSICSYITNKVPNINVVEAHPKINLDTLQRLRKDGELSLFEITFKPNSALYHEFFKDENMLEATNYLNDFDSISLKLTRRITKKKKGFKSPISIEKIREILAGKERENINKFIIKDRIYSDEIDLLSDRLVFKEKLVPIKNTKTIQKEDAYTIIKSHFYDSVIKYCKKSD